MTGLTSEGRGAPSKNSQAETVPRGGSFRASGFRTCPLLPVGIHSPAKGVVNMLFIVLKSEGLQMLLFQVKGAALSESWLVLEDPALQSGPE